MVLGNVSILYFCPLKMLGNDKAVTQPTLGIFSQRNMLMVLVNVSILYFYRLKMLGNDKAVAQPTLGIFYAISPS